MYYHLECGRPRLGWSNDLYVPLICQGGWVEKPWGIWCLLNAEVGVSVALAHGWHAPNHGPKPYKFIGFGDIHGPKPYKFIGYGDIHGPKPYRFIRLGT